MKVALVAAMAAPYRLPVWEALGQRLEQLDVLLCSERESNRIWRDTRDAAASYSRTVLPGFHRYVLGLEWGFHWNPTLLRHLRRVAPDAIIVNGYDSPSYLTAMAYARVQGVPLVLSVEGHAESSRFTTGPIAAARRRLVRAADACLAHGRASADYVAAQGMPRDRIVTGILPVDVERVGRLADAIAARSDRKVPPVQFISVGRLTGRKRVIDLVDAFRTVDPCDACLTIVGHGPLQQRIEAMLAEPGLEHVRFAGASSTLDETVAHLGRADVLVMPSVREVWGLVVNEALAAGLYVIASRTSGATPDLIEDAPFEVGMAIDPAKPAALAAAITAAAARVKAGCVDRDRIAQWGRTHTPERHAENMVEAIGIAIGRRSRLRGKES
ncbi:MAG TPA: glycosyltransferase family 4 protein [Longimicrobiales bacterium]|nr:glycosyltransferase family 4 protein [Longimicrobiales bacterium]